ncbi:rna-directed dna polymerase reverse transcriptase and integrase domain containing [Lasius niger]|uniref:RNA-directed DNA polymerase n=1 Tax=Lasius niger TaxID=67767 RepID=A0A0J7K7Q6_LASNI|nr:rna-directed dna polymerase reverse transcriptase and integrase domain containing [Lasius niger]
MQLDSGADITTIGTRYWTWLGCPKLQSYDKTCTNVSGYPIRNKGFFYATVSYKNKASKGPIVVIDRPNTALISAQAIDELGLAIYDQGITDGQPSVNEIKEVSLESKYPDLFSDKMGECSRITVHLRIKPDARPIYVPRRPIALALEEPVNAELDRLVNNGILIPVESSEWAASIVVARKANGKIRICADYSTGLNKALIADDHPIPNKEDLIAKLRGNSVYSQLDLSDAYLHLKLDETSRPLTTINTHRGLFVYNRLVFGLRPAPAIFQRTLEQALTDIPGILVYLDDILVCGRNRTEHDVRVHAVLNRLQEWGFRLRTEKCKFHTSVVKYLGFVISTEGIKPDPARIQPIETMRTPENIKEVRSFLGLVNYYGKFVPDLHKLKAPFEALLKKDVPFNWTSTQQNAFEKTKCILTGPLLLAHYDPKQILIVAADASSTGIGGVLLQRYADGQVKAVFHMSRTLTKAQQNYSQIEKEALALITAIERFRKFVYGRHFILQTDHRPLLALFKTANTKELETRTANRLKR